MYGGAPEAMTVTPAYFAAGGWLGPAARPRLGGSTLLEEVHDLIDVFLFDTLQCNIPLYFHLSQLDDLLAGLLLAAG